MSESTSYLQFHKILSDESYTLGRDINQFITDFGSRCKLMETKEAMEAA
jgi:hypothetical protein